MEETIATEEAVSVEEADASAAALVEAQETEPPESCEPSPPPPGQEAVVQGKEFEAPELGEGSSPLPDVAPHAEQVASDESEHLPVAVADASAREVEDIPRFGDGYMRLPCGGHYKGQFRFSTRHGEGTMVSYTAQEEQTWKKDEDCYEGQFVKGMFEGQGRRRWPNGTMYDGQWQKGRKHGYGTLEEADGRAYQGQFVDGLRHGKGIQIFNPETSYDGGWHKGQQHGTGVYSDTSKGISYEGKWKYGSRCGPGMHRSSNGAERETQSYTQGRLATSERLPKPMEYLPVRPATVAL